jgi:UDP-N-acetylmuramate dehydrogenase
VRAIRARKFPNLATHGTAGSFFKNPTISAGEYEALVVKYPELPRYEAAAGIKIPLAWILDHVLQLRGHRVGHVQCFPMQPLVIVTEEGATANDVNVFADDIARRVHDVTNIFIEREVRALK